MQCYSVGKKTCLLCIFKVCSIRNSYAYCGKKKFAKITKSAQFRYQACYSIFPWGLRLMIIIENIALWRMRTIITNLIIITNSNLDLDLVSL